MDPATIAFAIQLANIILTGAAELLPSVKALAIPLIDMLHTGRAPTSAEWAQLNAVSATLRGQLHDGSQTG